MTAQPHTPTNGQVRLRAGVPAVNNLLYHRIRFLVMDPAAIIDFPHSSTLIIRDIEMDRARKHARADAVACPADFAPNNNPAALSGDREIATAQATAQCLKQAGVSQVTVDRTLPMIYAHELQAVGVRVNCDPDLGILERRAKDAEEIEHLRAAQQMTERAVELACVTIARAKPDKSGVLHHEGAPLTAERVRAIADIFLLENEFTNASMIVAPGKQGGDCHDRGTGRIRTGESVIIDVFPRSNSTLYVGDCTRCVVHGDIPDEIAKMHAVVCEAKAAAIAATRAGVTGEQINNTTAAVITKHGYHMGLPPEGAPASYTSMPHGTGHGVGLDVHEPPLLDRGGPALIKGDAITIEPGLYRRDLGGIRIEDMVIVTDTGCDNLNTLQEGLVWK
ncbi:MAG: aminopeptidase P family protein [Phycisphaerales bacterium]|nr:aminopeptidase P family protein [Phycisphaerales bacterium]